MRAVPRRKGDEQRSRVWTKKNPLSLSLSYSLYLSPSRRRGYKRKGPVGAPRTRGERSGKEMRKSVINWRWDYSRRALRRQAARRTTWKVLPDTFRSLSAAQTYTYIHTHIYIQVVSPSPVSSGAMDGSLAGPVRLRSPYGPASH